MKRLAPYLETLHVLALAAWCGSVVMTGLFAAKLFPMMRRLDPRLGEFAAYDGEHWRLAAGRVANEMFRTTDVVQFVTAFIAAFTLAGLIAVRAMDPRRISTWARGLGVMVALAALMGLVLFVNPAFDAATKGYWAAAAAGDTERALSHQAALAEIHPMASRLVGIAAIGSFVGLCAGVWQLAVRGARAEPAA